MKVIGIAAISFNNVYCFDNKTVSKHESILPSSRSLDKTFLKNTIEYHTNQNKSIVVIGKNTYDQMYKLLKNVDIFISDKKGFHTKSSNEHDDYSVLYSDGYILSECVYEKVLNYKNYDNDINVIVLGGNSVYDEFKYMYDLFYLTVFKVNIDNDNSKKLDFRNSENLSFNKQVLFDNGNTRISKFINAGKK